MVHGINGNGLTLQPHEGFMKRLETALVAHRLLGSHTPYIISIDHKLNVARYSAGLIQAMSPADYGWHRFKKPHKGSPSKKPTKAEYAKRCVYYAYDWEQYSLGLLFSIESLAAASFSLFDTCAYLMIGMFNLNLPRKEQRPDPNNPGRTKTVELEPSFVNVVDDLNNQGAPNLYNFLNLYRPGHPKSLVWISKLKRLRNHTTHAQITDIVELRAPTIQYSEELWLYGKVLGKDQQGKDLPDVILKDFAQESFNGLEIFVEQLYEKLAILTEAEKSLPLSVGRYDNLV